jgi:hypothetical protein
VRGTFRLVIAGVVMGSVFHGELGATAKPAKGRSKMTLDLDIHLKRNEFITSESLPVEASLTNQGDSAVAVADPGVASTIDYVLAVQGSPEDARHLSSIRAMAERTMEPPWLPQDSRHTLAPGAKDVYDEDLADYQVPTLGPGNYSLKAMYRDVDDLLVSTDVTISISPPRIARMTTLAASSDPRIAVAFLHQAESKRATIYQVENRSGRPGDGVAYPRLENVDGAGVRGIALASELSSNRGRRWWAWMDSGEVGAGFGGGRYISQLVASVKHSLHEPSLLPVGWQLTDSDAIFIVLGTAASGQGALAVAAFNRTAPSGIRTIPVALSGKLSAWAARYRVVGADAQIDLVTATETAGTAKVVRQVIALGTGKASTPSTLLERGGRVSTVVMAPIAAPGNDTVDVLFAPNPKTGYLSLVRLPLGGGAPRAGWEFSPPKSSGGKHPTAWAIPRTPIDPPVVATHIGDKIFVRRGGDSWTTLVEHAGKVEHLSLEAFQTGYVVAIWSDPSYGVRYREVR